MLFFRNDYGQGCLPEILNLLQKTNDESVSGYGIDSYCDQAKQLLRSHMPSHSVDIHFIVGATLANLTIIKSILKPYEGVIACDTGHISAHEAGSIEATGHKIITVTNSDGKLNAHMIEKVFNQHMDMFEHMIYPKMVYISNSTELGTVYTREELESIHAVCQKLGLYLFIDGARLGAALMSGVDYTMDDIAGWADVFYVGGTKNAALFGEAIVFTNPDLATNFRFIMKQDGAMLAKGWLLGLQFIGLFENNMFFDCAKQANDYAMIIQDYAYKLGYSLYMRSTTNQIFINVNQAQYEYLSSEIDFEIWEKNKDTIAIRLVTSWHTTMEEVEACCNCLLIAKELKK